MLCGVVSFYMNAVQARSMRVWDSSRTLKNWISVITSYAVRLSISLFVSVSLLFFSNLYHYCDVSLSLFVCDDCVLATFYCQFIQACSESYYHKHQTAFIMQFVFAFLTQILIQANFPWWWCNCSSLCNGVHTKLI